MDAKRGVSELIAAVILLAIVVAAGGVLLATAYSHFSSASELLTRESTELEAAARSRAAVVAAKLLDNGTLQLVVASGRFPVRIEAVYVNSTLCLDKTFVVPPLAVVKIVVEPGSCPPLRMLPAAVPVEVVYDGGEVLLYASR